MFTGKYQAKVDSVGRVTIPARLREELGKRFILSTGLDECLLAYTEEQWQKEVLAVLESVPQFSRGGSRAVRLLSSSAQPLEMDKQFRVVLPEEIRQQAGIKDEIVFVGALTKVEIWARERWDREEVLLQSEDTRSLVRELLEKAQVGRQAPLETA